MRQDLEKYLKTNRSRFDSDEPDDDSIWQGIKEGIHQKKQNYSAWFWKVAALFLFVVLASYFLFNQTQKDKIVVVTLADISNDLGQQEALLKHEVNLKWEELKPIIPKENSDIRFLLNEVNDLDEVYKIYQNDLGKSDSNEEIIKALLDYYEKKMKILNRILHEIEKQKNHETIVL